MSQLTLYVPFSKHAASKVFCEVLKQQNLKLDPHLYPLCALTRATHSVLRIQGALPKRCLLPLLWLDKWLCWRS